MKIVTSVLVDDQEKALRFYTNVLGFVVKHDIPMGHARWLTVVSPDNVDGVELLLEPSEHPAAGPFKKALVEDGSHSHHLASMMFRLSTLDYAKKEFTLPNHPSQWGQLQQRCLMIRAVISFRSLRNID